VPRLFEKISAALQARAAGKSLQQRILGLCLSNAQSTYERRSAGKPLGLLEHLLFEGLQPIRRKIRRELFGVNFTHAISGGAKLDAGVNRFFDSLEITICEGYGLTETCVATHVNRPTQRRIGSVGPAFEGVETKISPEDGEILLRGPNVTRGYLNRPKATADSWDADGWFHTGDVGAVDQDGFLFITDRKKELVITAGGKKIPPTAVEGQFKRFSFISHALLYGEGRPYCVILFTLNEPELRSLLTSSGISVPPDHKLSEMSAVRGMLQDAINKVNETLATYESIKAFCIADEDFTVENGLLTPTLKMRRRQITARHLGLISSLY
jgi:long-chain acyl-CoA synthetase